MYIYLLYFICIAISGLLIRKGKVWSNKVNLTYIVFVITAFILLSGLRGIKIGLDTPMYKSIWETVQFGHYHYDNTTFEIGFYYLMVAVKSFTTYQIFLFVVAILSMVPVGYSIYKYSKIVFFSLLLFYSSIYFHTLEFAAERQAIAFGLTVVAFHFLMQRKLPHFLCIIALAFLFHATSIIFLPCYWIYNLKISRKLFLYWIIIMLISFSGSAIFFNFLNSYSRIDYSGGDITAGGQRLFAINIAITLLGFMNYKRFNNNPSLRLPFLLYTISPLLWPILNSNPALYRLQFYFDFYLCLWVPNLVKSLPKQNLSRTLLIILTVFESLYIILVMRESEAYFPYKFFWE